MLASMHSRIDSKRWWTICPWGGPGFVFTPEVEALDVRPGQHHASVMHVIFRAVQGERAPLGAYSG